MMNEPLDRNRHSLPTQRSLIERAKVGDEAAWTVLYERYRGLIAGQLRLMGVPEHAIDDVAQIVLLAFSNGSLRRFDWRSKFRTFLHGCVRNAGLKWFREEKRSNLPLPLATSEDDPVDKTIALPDAAFDIAFDRTTIESALAAVRAEFEKRGEAMLFEALFECLDKSRRELRETTAQQLGFASDRIRTRISRLRKDIQGAIRQHIYDVIPDPVEAEAEYLRLARPYLG